jgi:hypothetical protein
MKFLTAALAVALLAGAVAPAAAEAQGQCLRQDMVNGWKVVDDRTLIVTDRVGHQYTVALEKGCTDLAWPMRLGFSADTGFGLSCITRHSFVYVPANGGTPRQRCMISDVQPYGAPIPGSTALNH